MQLLVAEDDRSSRLMMTGTIRQWGYEVIEASDGNKAMEILNSPNPPRIAVLDWVMPGRDGIEICRELILRPNAPLIYTILVTGESGREDLVYALDNGAHDFLTKPVNMPELRSRLAVGRRLIEADCKVKEYAQRMAALAEKLSSLAMTDPLTNAYNRRSFLEQADKEHYRAKRHGSMIGALVIDIDRFKDVNDTFGHAAGDEVLKTVASASGRLLRETDVFGRLGGDEFAAILPEADTQHTLMIAERLLREFEKTRIEWNEQRIPFTVSIGAASIFPDDGSVESLLNRADMALLQAKREGRNRVCVT